MSNADVGSLIIVAGLLVIAICLLVYYIFFRAPEETGELTVETDETSPYLQQIGKFRDTFVKNLVTAFGIVWYCKEEELHVAVQPSDWDNHLITLIYKNHMVRCYVNWNRNKVRISYTFQASSLTHIKAKTFRLKNNSANYEAIQKWGMKNFIDVLLGNNYTLDDLVAESINDAKAILGDKEKGEREYKKMLVEVWENYIVHTKKDEIKNDLENFKKLTAYISRYCPKELDEYIAEHNKVSK